MGFPFPLCCFNFFVILYDLYKLGARKMVVFQLGPLARLLAIRSKQVKPTSNCAEDVNKLVSTFNDKLGAKIKELSEKLEGSSFVATRIFDLIKIMIQNSKDYGESMSISAS